MKRKPILALFVIITSYLFLSSCMLIDKNISSLVRSNIYRGTLASSGTLNTYFLKDKGDVPYVDIIDVTRSALNRDITSKDIIDEGFKVTRNDNESYMVVDPDLDTIYFSNYEAFISKTENNKAFNPKSASYVYTNTDSKEETYTKEVTFNLKNYNIDIVESKGVVYVPFQIYDTLIYSQLDVSLAFNGHDYYYVSDSSYLVNRNYYLSYFNGRNQSGVRSTEMANFTYNHLMFALDFFFGIKETRGIKDFNSLCETESLKNDLLSTNCETFNNALNNLIYTYLDDGHSSFQISSNYLEYDPNADVKYSDKYTGVRRKLLTDTKDTLSNYRQASRGNFFSRNEMRDTYNVSGNTLIITLDSFNFPTQNYYDYLPNSSNYNKDSFSIMYYALNKYIPNYESTYRNKISNVVIDVTLNGGGYVDDCLGLIGFLSNNYYVNYENYASKDRSKVYYTVDTNLDNKFNELDSFKGKYNFYILTSNYSFSCANMLASIAKEQKLATIIGEESGGGGNIVYNLCLGDSTSINISGCHSLIYFDEYDKINYAENKITPDYKLNREFFYSPTAIDTFIKTISK